MEILGFHPVDIGIIIAYLMLITYIGKRSLKKVHNQEDYFLAGRGVGKFFQYFLNMGTIVDAGNAANTASAAFSRGLGGVWILLAPILGMPTYGQFLLDCVLWNRTRSLLGGLLVYTGLLLAGNLIADLLLVAIDPRIRYD